MSLFSVYPEADYIFDIEIFHEYGKDKFAQAHFLVHGYDDCMWTNDPQAVGDYIKESVIQALENKE